MSKLALLIGINYIGTDNALSGCINDVYRMKNMLIKHFGYKEENITMMTDNDTIKPTSLNILKQLGSIISSGYNRKCDEIFIHYSGHGTYITDMNNDEVDSQDEALVPLDYETAGLITDDLLHDYFAYLPKSCRCVCVIDCCHSGTMLDLPYKYFDEENYTVENSKARIKADLIMISGCKDAQTSADAFISGKWAGAMTDALCSTLEKYRYNVTFFHLLNDMREHLLTYGYEQVPQICSNVKLRNTSVFASSVREKPYFRCIE
jgi:hypothetical protein